MISTLKIKHDSIRSFTYDDPEEIGYFSLNGNRDIVFSKQQLRYLVLPENCDDCHFDLNEGSESTIKRNYLLDKNMENILKWIKHEKLSSTFDFVCYSGVLRKLILLSYEVRLESNFFITASKFGGTIYLCMYYDPAEEGKLHSPLINQKESRWYKFKQFVTSNEPGGAPNTTKELDENEDYYSVFKSKLNSHSLLIATEIDCMDPNKTNTSSMTRYVGLKTSFDRKSNLNKGYSAKYIRSRTLTWWSSLRINGIENIICGYKNVDGLISTLQEFKLSDFTQEPEDELWNANVCMNVCADFLDFVKECVTKDDPKIVFTFEYKPAEKLIEAREMAPNSKYCFLPTWY